VGRVQGDDTARPSIETTPINPDGDLPEPGPIMQAVEQISKTDGYVTTETNKAELERQWP
jgi:hypothetical protein